MSTTTAAQDAIVQEITIYAPAERIFQVLTNPEELVKWWGIQGRFQATEMRSDLRVGGRWSIVTEAAGKLLTVAGQYRRIERPRLLEYTWIRDEDNVETVVRWELEEHAGATTVRVTHSGLTTEALRKRNVGWPLILPLLKSYVDKAVKPGEPPAPPAVLS